MGMENGLVFTALTAYIRSMCQKIARFKSFHALIMNLILLLMFLFELDINLFIALCTQHNELFFLMYKGRLEILLNFLPTSWKY